MGEGEHDIHRYEFIREAMSLDEQHCLLDVVKAITVDGIRVRVNQIHVRYKLRERENLWTTSVGETMDGEAYRNAIKLDVENTAAWRKFENMVVRIYEEGGC